MQEKKGGRFRVLGVRLGIAVQGVGLGFRIGFRAEAAAWVRLVQCRVFGCKASEPSTYQDNLEGSTVLMLIHE